MAKDISSLGGRLPLLRPKDLSESQRKAYEFIDAKFVSWADKANFQSKTEDGRLIGPFNPALYSPEMTTAFLAWQLAEMEHTSLDARTREVVILAVGAVWQAEYELYAHSAVARMAGLSETAISKLCAGEPAEAEGLSYAETIAQRYATQLTASRRLDDDLSASARDLFGPKGLMDLVNLIGAYQTVCGTLNAFAIPVPIESLGAHRRALTTAETRKPA